VPRPFSCTSCSTPLEYDESKEIIRCHVCGTSVIPGQTAASEPASIARDPRLDEIRSLSFAGNKIAAIKLYRETYGVGLKEAKDAVEALERGGAPASAPIHYGSMASGPRPMSGGLKLAILVVFLVLLALVGIAVFDS
jgi:LSD1 subclass zinc finger protein